jgi:putative endonuclease
MAKNDGESVPPWFVYLIECRDGSIYTGIAIDVAARYAAHCSGKGARYTRAHPPLRLLASVAYADRSSALKAEYRIKQLTAADKHRLVAELLTCGADSAIPASKKP